MSKIAVGVAMMGLGVGLLALVVSVVALFGGLQP